MPFEYFSITLIALLIYQHLAFACSLWRKNMGIMDIFWGPGFLLIGLVIAQSAGLPSTAHGALLIGVALWSVRLAAQIWANQHGKTEDWRYAKWRKEWGKWAILRGYGQVFLQNFF